MAIIDPDGLFQGERLAACSDRAKLLWPYIYSASNGYGRIELNLRAIQARCFVSFTKKPSEEELFAVITEYAENFLLLIYEVDGEQWAQWDTSEKYLPPYKSAKDKMSPAPSAEEQNAFIEAYVEHKRSKCHTHQRFQKFSEKFQDISEEVQNISRGIGIGIGIGIGTGVGIGNLSEANASSPRRDASGSDEIEHVYGEYPRKEGRRAALIAIERASQRLHKGETPHAPMPLVDARRLLFSKARQYARSPAGQNPDHTKIPHPATWFNQSRYLDDDAAWQHSGVANGKFQTQHAKTAGNLDAARAYIAGLGFEGDSDAASHAG